MNNLAATTTPYCGYIGASYPNSGVGTIYGNGYPSITVPEVATVSPPLQYGLDPNPLRFKIVPDTCPYIDPNMQPENQNLRLVQLYIVDPNKNIPLDDALLFEDGPFLTNLTDAELWYKVPVQHILDDHNEEVRAITVDKDKSTKTEKVMLEPARTLDLSMQVISVAHFFSNP